jgi:nucleoid-associated protein YgaU
VLPFLAAPVYGQSIGDLARQERARKQNDPHETAHVYNNDDLTRSQILLPEDREQTAKQQGTPPSVAPAEDPNSMAANSNSNAAANAPQTENSAAEPSTSSSATGIATPTAIATATATTNLDPYDNPGVDPNTLPLGDIARHYRALKAERQQAAQSAAARQPLPKATVVAYPWPAQLMARPVAQPQAFAPLQPVRVAAARATAKATARATGNATADLDPYDNPNIDPNTLPLGDIARHFRALKAAREQQETELAAARHPLPAAIALADPTFTQPATRHAAQARSFAPPPTLRAAPADVAPAPLPRAQSSSIHQSGELAVAPPIRAQDERGRSVRVQAGDTLWVLARKYLGRATDWSLLAARNPQVTAPTRLQVGTLLLLPDIAAARAPDPGSRQQVRVVRGESLWALAQLRYGNGVAWSCIAQANPSLQNTDLIFPGQRLTIPTDCPVAARNRGTEFSAESSAVVAAQPLQQPR